MFSQPETVVHVHDLVDFVSEEAALIGKGAGKYIQGTLSDKINFKTVAGDGLGYVVPQSVTTENLDKDLTFYMRVRNVLEKQGDQRVYRRRKGRNEERREVPAC